MKVTIIIPVYNEVNTIEEILRRVESQNVASEILIVDDGSTDGTREKLHLLEEKEQVKVILRDRNQGKGAAVRTGIENASGDVLLIQDADLEYDPRDYPELLQPIEEGIADVVYGSRFLGGPRRTAMFWHYKNQRTLPN